MFTWISAKQNTTVNHTIISKDTLFKSLQVQLKFEQPRQVSNTSDQDILEVKVLQTVIYNNSGKIVFLLQGSADYRSIPPQLTGFNLRAAKTMENGRITITANEWYDFLISAVIQIIWMHFDDFSFLMINTLISLSVPGITQIIQQVLVNFIYLDLLMMEKWMPFVIRWINGGEDPEDEPLNNFFEDNGVESKLFINNIGSGLIFFLIYSLTWLFLALLRLLSMWTDKPKALYCRVKALLMWKLTISLLFSQFVPFLMSGLINLKQLDKSNPVSIVSSLLCLTVLLGLILTVTFIFLNIRNA